jgi:hypothetical protein
MSQSGLEGGKYFHRDGSPAETYSEVSDEVDEGLIAKDVINNVIIETSFTGFNVGTFVEPKIFTTSILGGLYAGDYDYATEEEAVMGHNDFVQKISVPLPVEVEQLAKEIRELATTNEYRIAEYVINKRKCCNCGDCCR